jgi:hypothetical protein
MVLSRWRHTSGEGDLSRARVGWGARGGTAILPHAIQWAGPRAGRTRHVSVIRRLSQ